METHELGGKVETKPTETKTTPTETGPIYKGPFGEVRTAEDWAQYAKNAEKFAVENQMKAIEAKPSQPTATQPTAKQRFADLIFSNPDQAYDILRQDAEENIMKKINAERAVEKFWVDFYDRNQDLRDCKQVVEYVFEARKADFSDVRKYPTAESIFEALAKEVRGVLDVGKKRAGSETVLNSGAAVTMGASGESTAAPLIRTDSTQTDFSAQLMKLRKKR